MAGRRLVLHRIPAEAGQRLTARLSSANAAVYFNLYAPGTGPGDAALAIGSLTGPLMPEVNRLDAPLAASGTYTIAVYLYRAAARRGE